MARLAQLDGKQAITGEQLVERGRVLEELKRASEALDAYQAALDRAPNNAEAALGAGRLLLAGGAAAGVDLVTRSMELDVRLVPAACEILVDYSTSQRRFAEAERYRARWARYTIRARLVEATSRSHMRSQHQTELQRASALARREFSHTHMSDSK